MVEPHNEEYYTVPEAASALGISPATVWRWIDAGRLPAYRVGPKRIRIRRDDIESLVRPTHPRQPSGQIWHGYDAAKVCKAIAETAGTWSDLDTETTIADIHRARQEGSRQDKKD